MDPPLEVSRLLTNSLASKANSHHRDRTILLTLFQTEVRESSLAILRLKHIKELFEGKVPAHIGLRAKELKGKYYSLECHTFLGNDSIEAIKKYLDWRKNSEIV